MTSDPDSKAGKLVELPAAQIPKVAEIKRQAVSHRRVSRVDWKNRAFVDFNGLGSEFEDCDFRYSIFERAYFRDAKFKNCRFEGCRFIECNMKNTRFLKCDFKFAQFSRCLLDVREIIAALPPQPNIRREALRNLKSNSAEVGDFDSIKLIVLHELEATKLHFKHAAVGYDAYYRDKYTLLSQRLAAGANFGLLKVDQWLWGHGERPWRLLISGVTILLALTVINFWAVLPRVNWAETNNGWNALDYSIRLFLDMPTNARFRGFSFVDYFIVSLRYVYIGLFISVLYKVISHR